MTSEFAEARYAATIAELNQERANALERLGRRVAAAHEQYTRAVQAVDAQPATSTDPELASAHRAALRDFQALRWEYSVHREALGLLDHSWVDRTYPLAARDRPPGEPTEAQRRLLQYRLSR